MNIQIKNRQSAIGNRQFVRGFSLTEVLMAIGMLGVGMLFIAGVFPVGLHFSTVSTERTIAATVADEAFAKLTIHGADFNKMDYSEFAYPSTPTSDPNSRRYWWSYCYNIIDANTINYTVFVSRKVGAAANYRSRDLITGAFSNLPFPTPIYVDVFASPSSRSDELMLNIAEQTFINDGYTILDVVTGQIYRVMNRTGNIIKLDKNWTITTWPGRVWTITPPISGGRYPCIGVYQKIVRY